METTTIGDVSVTELLPRFDAYTANDGEKELRDQIAKGLKKIIVDFSRTEYVASAGLRVLLSVAKSLHNLGGQIVLFSMKPQVYKVFTVSGVTQIFKIYGSQQEAIEGLK